MNSIRQTQALNKRELEAAVPPSASWHADYRDTAYIYIGGFPFDLSEGDLLTIFSQYGNPTHLNLVRDRETGKSKGFAFLKYEDQRSCDLAVDNLGGAEVLGRLLKVDHTRYKKKEGEDEETWRVERLEGEGNREVVNENGKRSSGGEETEDDDGGKRKKRRKRGMIKEELELEQMLRIKEDEDEDPMRQYLIEEKKREVEEALDRVEKKERHHHKHHRGRDRSRGENGAHKSHRHRDEVDERRSHRHHHRGDEERAHRSRKKDTDEEDRHSRRQQRRHVSDGESSPSRSTSRRRRNRERSDSRSRKGKPTERRHSRSRRRTPEYEPPSRSRSPFFSKERRRDHI